ncbi:MAG TPA: glutathione peroxidase [Bacilli bacterium]|nr:glutathione peroxidase [Bacilli bacterium]
MNVHQFKVNDINSKEVAFSSFKGKTLIIVNTASKCGFTPQFKELEELYQQYKDKGLVVLGFPCNQFMNQDPGTNEEILSFCELNYGVTFPMFSKIDVNGDNAHPLYKYLTSETKTLLSEAIKWNFTKFLVDKNGNVVERYAPQVSPLKMKKDIEKLL